MSESEQNIRLDTNRYDPYTAEMLIDTQPAIKEASKIEPIDVFDISNIPPTRIIFAGELGTYA